MVFGFCNILRCVFQIYQRFITVINAYVEYGLGISVNIRFITAVGVVEPSCRFIKSAIQCTTRVNGINQGKCRLVCDGGIRPHQQIVIRTGSGMMDQRFTTRRHEFNGMMF